MPSANIPINCICLTSAEWAAGKVQRPLNLGEPAFEITDTTPPAVFLLKGDGYLPTQGETSTDYRRLRVSVAVSNGGNVEAIQTTIDSLIQRDDALDARMDAEQGAWAAAVSEEMEAREAADGLLQENITAEAAARAQAVSAEAAARAQADAALQGDITAEATARQTADNTLQTNINNEAAARTQADNTEKTARQNADNTLQTNINNEAQARATADTALQTNINNEAAARAQAVSNEATARQNADNTLQSNINAEATARQNADNTLQTNINNEATEREQADTALDERVTNIEETYAPLLSPVFSGEPEVPDPLTLPDGSPKSNLNMAQAVPLEIWKRLYDLTMSTSGAFLRETDTAQSGETVYERRLDCADGVSVYEAREVDHISWLDGDFVTQAEWDEIRDMVMSTVGENLLAVDGETDNADNRVVDRAYGDAEYRELDSVNSENEGAINTNDSTWVDD